MQFIMKKNLLISMAMLLSFVALAQVQCTFLDNPDISAQFKRCVAIGNTAYVDFILTNNGRKDLRGYVSAKEHCAGYDGYISSAYDDEGNVYTGYDYMKGWPDKRLYSVTIAGTCSIVGGSGSFTLPSGIPVKGRIEIKDLDGYATMFNLVKIAFRGMSDGTYGIALLELKNVPITRQ